MVFRPHSLLLEELTWPEIEEALDAGFDTCLIISGSIEQHGPHLPLLTDAALGQELALRTASRLGKTLVAPVIRPGCSEHHLPFPGSLTVPEELLMGIIQAYCRCLIHHGFRNLVLLSSHGGNFDALNKVPAELKGEVANRASIVAVADLWALIQAQYDAVAPMGVEENQVGTHAGLAETSEMMVVRPDLVREDRLTEGYRGKVSEELFEKGLKHYTRNGVLGDARGSKPEYGHAILQSLTNHLVSRIREALQLEN